MSDQLRKEYEKTQNKGAEVYRESCPYGYGDCQDGTNDRFYTAYVEWLESQLSASREEVARLREVLEPFAEFAQEYLSNSYGNHPKTGEVYGVHFRSVEGKSITVEMLKEAIEALSASPAPAKTCRPKVICLCGSTRFYDQFQESNYAETMKGNVVLSVGFYPHAKAKHGHGEGIGHDSLEKIKLDELHKRKIDLADEVLILNVGGYIGESTRSEINYAVAHGKPVKYLEPIEEVKEETT
jgi:hypothetical protein